MDKIIIRELDIKDFKNGYIETLNELSPINTKDNNLIDLYYTLFYNMDDYFFYVAVIGDMVVGCATLFVERKYIHNGGLSGHIEDVVVREGYRGGDIGSMLVKKLIDKAKQVGCYKVLLDCGCDVAPFYDKLGMIGEKVMYKIKFEKRL